MGRADLPIVYHPRTRVVARIGSTSNISHICSYSGNDLLFVLVENCFLMLGKPERSSTCLQAIERSGYGRCLVSLLSTTTGCRSSVPGGPSSSTSGSTPGRHSERCRRWMECCDSMRGSESFVGEVDIE